jgi:hypothetical protein
MLDQRPFARGPTNPGKGAFAEVQGSLHFLRSVGDHNLGTRLEKKLQSRPPVRQDRRCARRRLKEAT